MEVVVHRLAAALLRELAAGECLARVDEAQRDAAPRAGVGRVPAVGLRREAGRYAALAVGDANAPRAAAHAGETDLEGHVGAARAVLAQQEGQRLQDRDRRRLGEARQVRLEVLDR